MYLFMLLSIFFFSVTTTNSRKLKPKFCVNCKYFISNEINKEQFGIWGGLTQADRVPIRKQLNIILKGENVA